MYNCCAAVFAHEGKLLVGKNHDGNLQNTQAVISAVIQELRGMKSREEKEAEILKIYLSFKLDKKNNRKPLDTTNSQLLESISRL
ncbi:hypothetical protein Cyrtocomes_00854 [Candidatus Cyrtobacter comes]|uniref:Uncharacterized protein n=1 Tax=Candidatus Cyrtobacter comes TaxID=675776 RepID=A0ABU5L989_9RICK|nr:hypothetical protein [Candidatus Cyrtobacter comes]MDZ5762470.1 hypothetical protein [Candidatus Cyrtobacter comes]